MKSYIGLYLLSAFNAERSTSADWRTADADDQQEGLHKKVARLTCVLRFIDQELISYR